MGSRLRGSEALIKPRINRRHLPIQARDREICKRDASREDFASGKGASGRGASLNSDLRPVKNRVLSPHTTNPSQCISSSSRVPPSPLLSHLCVASPSSESPLTLFRIGHPLRSSSRVLYLFVLSLTILLLTVHPSLLPLSPALSSTLCPNLSFSLFLFPFSVAPQVPLVPVVDSTSARSRFANIARKRRRRRRLRGRILSRARAPFAEFRRNFQVRIPSTYHLPRGRVVGGGGPSFADRRNY